MNLFDKCVYDKFLQAKHEIFAVLDDSTNTGAKGLADIDIRLTNLNKHVADLEEAIDSRPLPSSSPPPNFGHEVAPSNNDDYERLNKRVDRAYKWQEGAERTLRDLSTKLQPINGEVRVFLGGSNKEKPEVVV